MLCVSEEEDILEALLCPSSGLARSMPILYAVWVICTTVTIAAVLVEVEVIKCVV
jgi:hypothetical protein